MEAHGMNVYVVTITESIPVAAESPEIAVNIINRELNSGHISDLGVQVFANAKADCLEHIPEKWRNVPLYNQKNIDELYCLDFVQGKILKETIDVFIKNCQSMNLINKALKDALLKALQQQGL
ncbi:MAG: hypothetical protein WC942_04050 [Clostridia bacterium]|jgi:hypothetical protein